MQIAICKMNFQFQLSVLWPFAWRGVSYDCQQVLPLCRSDREALPIASDTRHEYILSQQLEKSGTGIRANVTEGQQGQSRADFVAKLSVALKETSETKYWLSLLYGTGYLTDREYQSIQRDCIEIEKMLTSILKTAKANTVSK